MRSFQIVKKENRIMMVVHPTKNTYLSQLSARGADLKTTEINELEEHLCEQSSLCTLVLRLQKENFPVFTL